MQFWWIRNDACGMFSAALTVALILYAQFVIVTVVVLPWYGYTHHIIFYTLSSLLALYSHSRAQYMDPGAVPRSLVPPPLPPSIHEFAAERGAGGLPPTPRICRECRTLKSGLAYHCSICQRCVLRMDHHCPWVNNCVGLRNQKYFMLFLLYTAVCCVYSGYFLVARFLSCTNNPRQCTISGAGTALCILNFVEALVFGLFVIVMMFDQFSAIFDGTARNQDTKNGPVVPIGKYEALCEVFGERLSFRWLLPLDMPDKVDADRDAELDNTAQRADMQVRAVYSYVEARRAQVRDADGIAAAAGAASALGAAPSTPSLAVGGASSSPSPSPSPSPAPSPSPSQAGLKSRPHAHHSHQHHSQERSASVTAAGSSASAQLQRPAAGKAA